VNAFVAAGAGFLLAVLWLDLMFDVQARDATRGGVAAPALTSVRTYYARVTTAARPMNRLIAAAMLATLAAIVIEIARGTGPAWLPWVSLALAGSAIVLAATRTVPAAVRLGTGREDADAATALARRVLAEHLYCFAAIGGLLVVQLGWG
jgi:hypothetical protein